MTDQADVFCELKYRVVVDQFGTRYYNADGQLHRDEGPAIEWVDGAKEWYQNGQMHRIGGPAVKWGSLRQWFLLGVEYTEQSYYEKLASLEAQNGRHGKTL